jgi:single-strand DNA-binding protein
MNSVNSILLEGDLIKNPEMGYTKKGIPYCDLTIVSTRYYKLKEKYQEEVSFFDVKTWGKLAEVCREQLKKNKAIRIIGRLKQDRWKNIEGKDRSRVYVIAEHIEYRIPVKRERG